VDRSTRKSIEGFGPSDGSSNGISTMPEGLPRATNLDRLLDLDFYSYGPFDQLGKCVGLGFRTAFCGYRDY